MNILKYIWKLLVNIFVFIYLFVSTSKFKQTKSGKTILFLIPWLTFGGAEKVNLEILEALKKDGWDIYIITTKAARHEWKSKFSEYTPNILHIEKLPQRLHTYIYLKVIKKFDIKLTFISNSFTGYMSTPHIFKITKVVDLVHSEGGPKDQGGSPAFSAPFDKYISKRIVISDRLKDLYINKYNIASDKIVIIRNGVDIEDVNNVEINEEIQQFIRKGRVVVWAARLSYEKRPFEVIELAKKLHDFNFLLIGEGEMLHEVKQNSENVSNLFVTGELANAQVTKIIEASDLVILTSEFEGIPMVILEAMALGKPVVATNVGAISEIIDNNINGYLCNLNSIQNEMPELIKKAYANKEEIKEPAIKKIKSKFNKSTMQEQYLKTFNELVK